MKVLVVVDMQNDFVYDALGTEEARAIVPKVVEKVCEYKKNGARIIFTQDTHDKDFYLKSQEGRNLPVEHCIKRTKGWEIIPELKDIFEIVCGIEKNTFGSEELAEVLGEWYYYDTPLGEDFEVIFCGVCTDICVISNILVTKACCPEIPITVDASCCAGVTPEKHKAALEVMRSCQINVINEEE